MQVGNWGSSSDHNLEKFTILPVTPPPIRDHVKNWNVTPLSLFSFLLETLLAKETPKHEPATYYVAAACRYRYNLFESSSMQ
jgi:hypothetical protein